jgi:small subunit ribosomal protein S4e
MIMHLKRYLIPKYWKMGKKANKYVVAPRPGPHKKLECIPLLVVLRDVLKICDTAKKAERVIKRGEILIDKKARKDPNYPVGFMDVVEIPGIRKCYRVAVDGSGLLLQEIRHEDADKKLCRIQGKRKVKGGAIQLSLHDGRNILTEKGEYNPNDSVLIELPNQKIIHHFRFEKGSPALIMSGRNMGTSGKLKEIINRKTMIESNRVLLQTKDKDIETVKEYVLVGEIK